MSSLPSIRYEHNIDFLGSPSGPGWVCQSQEGRGIGSTKRLAYQHWEMNTRPPAPPKKAPWWKRFKRQ